MPSRMTSGCRSFHGVTEGAYAGGEGLLELDGNENPFQTIVAGEFLNATDGMLCLLKGKICCGVG